MAMEYSTAGSLPYLTTAAMAAPPSSIMPPPPPPSTMMAPPTVGMLPYGVEIPNRVFVGGCPFSMTDQQLGDFFSHYGKVKDSKIIADRNTGKSKGYGFVTFASEEEAASVHAMGSIFYKEKKLNLSRAIRKCGGQFNGANQEFVNGQRAVWAHPSGYLIQQYDGSWHVEHHNHSQPVKPYYAPPAAMYYQPAPPPSLHSPQHFYDNGWSPAANGNTPQDEDNEQEEEEEGEGEQQKLKETADEVDTPTDSKNDSTDPELDDKLKQLSLDSAYTSEADLESSASHSPGERTPESHDQEGVVAESQEQSIKKVTAPSFIPLSHRHPPRRPTNLPTHFTSFSPPHSGGFYGSGVYQLPSPPYFNPYAAPYSYPYTPAAAIQTIGPAVYHSNQ